MRPTPEYVLELAAQIVAAKEELAKLTRQWDGLFQVNTQSALPLQSASGVNNGAKRRVLELVRSDPGRSFTSEIVTEALSLPTGTSRTTLSKLVRDGAIEKRGPALYGAIRVNLHGNNETGAAVRVAIQEDQLKEQTPTEAGV